MEINIKIVILILLLGYIFYRFCRKTKYETFNSDCDGQIVNFYTTWCGYSQRFLPEWKKFKTLAKKKYPNLKVVDIVCEGDDQKHCAAAKVTGFPTVIYYVNGKKVLFNRERTSENLLEFIEEHN